MEGFRRRPSVLWRVGCVGTIGCAGGVAGLGLVVGAMLASGMIGPKPVEDPCAAELRVLETLVARHTELRPVVQGAPVSEMTVLAEVSLRARSRCEGPDLERSRALGAQLCASPERTPAVTRFCAAR